MTDESYTRTVPVPNAKLGDRWVGMTFGPILINGLTPSATLTRIVVRFKRLESGISQGQPVSPDVFVIDSVSGDGVDAPATITNENTWIATIPVTQNFLPKAGDWEWDAAFYDSDNTSPQTLYRGVITVNTDV